jgi:D-sedoheptulose 7-phosphate isomerase
MSKVVLPTNLRERFSEVFDESAQVKRAFVETQGEGMARAVAMVVEAFEAGHKILLVGNGGSASDAQHIAAEWVGRFRRERNALPAMALTANTSDLTAIGNDYGFDRIFARQVEAHGQPGDILLAISTSGNSPNIIEAVKTAQDAGLQSIGLLGRDGGELGKRVDLAIVVPSDVTARIQESHITFCHALCELVDSALFPES